VLDVRCDAILLDLRGKERKAPRLLDRRDYGYAQGLGRYLKVQGQNGVLVRSARVAGDNVALLRAEVLSKVREKCFLTYRMNPRADEITVERVSGRQWLKIRPSALG